jgi:transposase
MLRAKGRGSGEWIDMKPKDLDALLERTRGKVSEEDFRLLKALADSLIYFTDVIENDRMTIRELRRLILGKGSERTRKVLLRAGIEGKDRESDKTEPPGGEKKKRPGHGRNGAEAYRGANRVEVSHPTLASGDGCPGCLKGKVYPQRPAFLVRVVGRSPIHADVYALAKFRCNLCGEVFTAPAPEGVGEEKYDASAAAMIGLLKYGTGLPFNRLEGLQESLGIPLPASTQWEIVEEASRGLEPVFEELVGQAAQGEILHNDDTSMKVLTLMKENEERAAKGSAKESDRTGIFTSGIVSMAEGRRIALFFTGRQHAGENLKDVLAQRNRELKTPIQMCDALSRNLPRELEVVLANCLAHGRRRFVGVVESFPEECRHVLETLRKVYENDATAKERELTPEERLAFHQAQSGPVMDGLQEWLNRQINEKLVEPNSGLGEAIGYMLRHWEKLTLFLREPGAPLDNNVVERALKKAILHRKNSLFYKTPTGARVGDLFMSLIHTCELSKVDPSDYLTELLRNSEAASQRPGDWMPWTYQETPVPTDG